jgi:polyhydroxyalkanoate synthase
LWRIASRPVDPAAAKCPALVVVPAHDRIVPPESAEAVVSALPEAERMAPPLGHIGMVVGSRARQELWEPLASWLLLLPSPPARPRKPPRKRQQKPRQADKETKAARATF